MWTHSGWEDCDAVCGGGKKKYQQCKHSMHMYIQHAYIYIYPVYIYTHKLEQMVY